MYQPVDDRVVLLPNLPHPDPGAPLPVVLANEWDVFLIYAVAQPDPDWDGRNPTSVNARSSGRLVATIRFHHARVHRLGSPNDEALSGHPLAQRGLRHYAAQEVEASSWIHALERMNSVHPRHDPARFAALRHYIFAFHDSTFECVAEALSVELSEASIHDVTLALVGEL